MASVLHIILIWLLAGILLLVTNNALQVFRRYVVGRIANPSDYRRIDTLSGVFRHAAVFIIIGVALMLSLTEIGISITPMLATAGVAGIAVGFGAQSLVRDFFSGLFLLIENQVSEGEMIEAAGKTGYVEEVTLRHIRMRDDDGSVHFIPNGIITTVTNRSREYAFAVIDINVRRRENLDRAFAVMRDVGNGMRKDPLFGPDILDDIDIAGVEKVDDASVTVRCRLKVMPLKQGPVRREFLRRVQSALDALPAERTADIDSPQE
ncbi:MAG: mechanosensitive ion channel [Herminiimonas sp.]|nr:mechanosensitive ion channel [Herminiimonas sp.]